MGGQVNLQGTYNYGSQAGPYTGYGSSYYTQQAIPGTGSATPTYAAPGSFDRQQLYNEFKSQMDNANQANLSRYNSIDAGYQSRHDRALAALQGQGDQERKDIAQGASDFASRMGQDAVSRGLGNTAIPYAGQLAAEKQRAGLTNALDERLAQQRIGLDTGLDQDRLQFEERRNDIGPSYEQLLSLSQGLGGAAGGSGSLSIGGGGGGAGYGKKDNYAGSHLSETELLDPSTGQWHNISSGGVTQGDAFWQTPGGRAIAADMAKTGKTFDQYTRGGQGWNPGSGPPGAAPAAGGGPADPTLPAWMQQPEQPAGGGFPAPGFDFNAAMGAGTSQTTGGGMGAGYYGDAQNYNNMDNTANYWYDPSTSS